MKEEQRTEAASSLVGTERTTARERASYKDQGCLFFHTVELSRKELFPSGKGKNNVCSGTLCSSK